MSGARVLVGTAKGAFVLTSDGKREDWSIDGPYFGGWSIYHVKGSPTEPNRIFASQTTDWFGQVVQRSDDGGKTWEPVGKDFAYEGKTGTHPWYDGTPRDWEFKRIWHIEPSPADADVVFAGAEDAALFRSEDGGQSWAELPGLRQHETASEWAPGAGGLCLHSIAFGDRDLSTIYIAISAAGVLKSEDSGRSWRPANKGLHSGEIPAVEAEIGHCVHHIALHPDRPRTLFMQKHWDVMRTDDGAETWQDIGGNLPTDFGFAIDIHAHEPDTIYVVPIKSDEEHYPLDGKLRVYRSRSGGNEWEELRKGLPERDCYHNVLRDAMAVDSLDPCGLYFGTTGGQVYASANEGDSWQAIAKDLPRVQSVEVQTLP